MNSFFVLGVGVGWGKVCVCSCAPVYTSVHVHVYSYMRGWEVKFVSSSVTLYLIFWDWVYDWNWSSLIWLTNKTWRFPSQRPSVLGLHRTTAAPGFYIGSGDPDSGLHAHTASALPTELLPQPLPSVGFVFGWLFLSFSFFSCSQAQPEIPKGTSWWPAISSDMPSSLEFFILGL